MRILVVLASPYPAPRGSQLLVQQLEGGLRRRGHDVTVASYGPWLRDRTGPHPARPFLDLVLLGRVLRLATRLRPQILHAHNYEAGVVAAVAARLLGLPWVYHGHSLMAEELPSYGAGSRRARALARLGAWLDRAVPRSADECIAVTPALAAALRRRGTARVTVMRPVADPDEIRALGPPDPPAAAPTVCYAGNLDGYQNLDLLRLAFARVRESVPDARLLLVTHARGALPAGLMAGGVDVVRAECPRAAWRAIGRAWVAVVPRVDPFGFPMKVLNYMAAGKAIVSTHAAGYGLRHDVDALIVPDAAPKPFASAVVDLLRDEQRRRRLGAAARAAASPAAWGGAMAALEAIYARAWRGGAARRPAWAPKEA